MQLYTGIVRVLRQADDHELLQQLTMKSLHWGSKQLTRAKASICLLIISHFLSSNPCRKSRPRWVSPLCTNKRHNLSQSPERMCQTLTLETSRFRYLFTVLKQKKKVKIYSPSLNSAFKGFSFVFTNELIFWSVHHGTEDRVVWLSQLVTWSGRERVFCYRPY